MSDYGEYTLEPQTAFDTEYVVSRPKPGMSKAWYLCGVLALIVIFMAYMLWQKPGIVRPAGSSVSDPYLTTWKELMRRGA